MLIVRRLENMEKHLQRPMVIVETGAIRIDSELAFEGDGHSTLLIARFVALSPYRHRFISVDLDQSVCYQVLRREGLSGAVELLTGDSREVLPRIECPVDAAYLDSGDGSDPKLMLDEAMILRDLSQEHAMFCCDDVMDYGKSGALLEWIATNGIEHEPEERLMFFWPLGRRAI